MGHIKEVLIDFVKSLKSKRVVSGMLTILFMAAWNFFTVTGMIVADSISQVNPSKTRE